MLINFYFSFLQAILIYTLLGKILIKKNLKLSIIEVAIFGLIVFSFILVAINFFFPLNQLTNTTILAIIITLFFVKEKKTSKKDLLILCLASIISFFLVLYDTVNRPDAYLYHLPYSQILNNEKIILGLSNLHFRFAHVSITQYLSSANYTYFVSSFSILSPISTFWTLNVIYYFYDVFKLIKKKETISAGKIFSIFVLIFISYKINRYSEFGNDMTGHLTMFYIVSKYLYYKKNEEFNLFFICLLVAFAIANKIFFIPAILIPLFIIYKEKLNFFKIFFKIPLFFIFLWFLKSFLISGCLVYPIYQTCITQVSWTNVSQIQKEKDSGEAWAKAWPQREDSQISMQDFNVNFNWIEAWLKQHFKLIIKIITPFIILILGTYFIVRGKQKFKRDRSKELFLIFFSFISMPFFFLKFPLYRYGYSYIIVFIIIFFIVFFFKSINQKKLIKIFKIYLFSSIIILVTKQANRIVHFWETRNPIPELSSNIDFEKKFNKIYISSEFFYYLSNKECYYEFYPCTNIKPETLKFKKIYTFKILYP
jgi:hypothetical protein